MKTYPPTSLRMFLAKWTLTASLALPGGAGASVTLVNWGGNYVSGDEELQRRPDVGSFFETGDFDGDTVSDDSRFGAPLSLTAPLSPATGYTGTSATFYGGVAITLQNHTLVQSDTITADKFAVHNGGTANDHLFVETQHSGNHHHTIAMMTFWDQSDFLNNGDIATITLDSTSSMSLSVHSSGIVNEETHLHFLVRDGTQFYVSEAFWGGAGADLTETGHMGDFPEGNGATATLDSSSPVWGKWAAYNPSGLDLDFKHDGVTWGTPNFTDVTAFGFFVDNRIFGQRSNNEKITVLGFNAYAVPEPGSALLALGGLLTGFLRRRR